jgi:hypothetical protein
VSDPKRLLETATELSDEERRLLVAGTEAAPPPELGTELWAALSAKLPVAGSAAQAPPASATGGAISGAPVGGLLIKATLAVLTLGALVFGVRALRHSEPKATTSAPQPVLLVASQSPPALPVPTEVAPSSSAPSSPAVSAAPAHVASAAHSGKAAPAHSAAVAPSSVASVASGTSDVSDESRAVTDARNALHGGNSASALAILSQAQQRFGNGVLGQEREALTIEALAKSGQSAAARARGQVFLKNYANSPYSARIRTLIGAN